MAEVGRTVGWPGLAAVMLVAVGLARIHATYDDFWQTSDEPAHIAAGMEWLETGRYAYEPMHPPLARVMVALPLYAAGVRGFQRPSMWEEGNAILAAGGEYERNLTLARLGVLPFFVAACAAVFLWAFAIGGARLAVPSLLLFSTLPPVLAHSAVATLDMACAAMVAAALFAFDAWLARPDIRRGIVLGVLAALAVLAKFSALAFLAAGGGAIVVLHGIGRGRPSRDDLRRARALVAPALAVGAAAFLTIWSGYRFTAAPWQTPEGRPHEIVDSLVGTEGVAHDVGYYLEEHLPVPARVFWSGLLDARGRLAWNERFYLLGTTQDTGWWYFYPVALFFKTPLPFALLVAAGGAVLLSRIRLGREQMRTVAPLVAAAAILVAGSTIPNKGSRQMLALYPLLAIAAGYSVLHLSTSGGPRRWLKTVGVAGLLVWHLGASVRAHPDYLPYFNELAQPRPDRILVDSDLDWGQDLKRLVARLEERRIDRLALEIAGSADLKRLSLDRMPRLEPYTPTTGWVAISELPLKYGTWDPPYDHFSWLDEHEPVERIGTSIRLYHIEPPASWGAGK